MKRVLIKPVTKVARVGVVLPMRRPIKPAPLDPKFLPPDYVARKVIINAFLYYVLDAPVISDYEYDRFSRYVADYWDDLHPDRQWACGSADQIRASGHHIKFSSMAVGAALNYHKYNTGQQLWSWPYGHPVWRVRRNGTSFVTCALSHSIPGQS